MEDATLARPITLPATVLAVIIVAVAGHGVSTAQPPPQDDSPPRSDPSGHVALLAGLSDATDDETVRQVWSLLKQRALTNREIGMALNHAFHLIPLDSEDHTWWVFDRRSAPEFVYIQPRKWVLLKDGLVSDGGPVDSTGNGVEVHPNSSGRGPFAWGYSVEESGQLESYEFRVHYEVTYAPKMKWLEGYENFLSLKVVHPETTTDATATVQTPPTPSPNSREGMPCDTSTTCCVKSRPVGCVAFRVPMRWCRRGTPSILRMAARRTACCRRAGR